MDSTTDDALEVIEQEAEAVGLALGLPPTSRLAQMIVDRIVERFGGHLLYIPSGSRKAMKERDDRIWAGFDGRNYEELARREGVTKRTVQYVVARRRLLLRQQAEEGGE